MKRTRQWNWLRFGLIVTMILTLTACGGGGGGGDTPPPGNPPVNPPVTPPITPPVTPPPTATQASVVVGGRAGSVTQLSSLIAASARSASAMKAMAGAPDPALTNAKVTLEVIKADGTSTKYRTVTDDNGAYSLEADIIVGDIVTVTFEKEGFTTFSKTLDTTGTAADEIRKFVVNGKAAQTAIIVSTKTGDAFKAGGGTGPGFRLGLMRAGSGVQRAFASSSDVSRAATSDGSKPELDINIPGSWAPNATALTAKLAAFNPANATDRAMFPGEFVGIGGGVATAGAAASKAAVEQTAYQLESVSFFSADVAPNIGELVTPAQVIAARAAGVSKAIVPGNALIYKYIPKEGCTAIQKYKDRDLVTAGVQVPLYTYKSSTGKWGYLGEGTLATYTAAEYFPAVVANADTSLANLACDTTDYYFAIETADWTTWWNLDYPILLEAPKTVTLCGTVVDKASGGNPVPGASVVADGYAKGANSYHYTYAGNDGKFELEILTGTGKELDKFDFAAYDYSTWPSPSSKDTNGSFPTLPADPMTTGCNQIGNVVVPNINTGMIEGTILEELTATTTKPLVGQWVWVESLDSANYFYNWAQTDSNGKFAMKAPLNKDLNVGVLDKSYPTKIDGVATGYEATDINAKVTLTTVKQPNSPPEVYTWIDPNPAKAGRLVTLSAWAWDPEGNEPLTYQWKIAGANQSTLSEFGWMPSTAGDYTVDVVVTDSKGKATTITQTLSVASASNSLPVIYYTWVTPATACGGVPTLYAYAYDPDGDLLTYTWSNDAGVLTGTTDANGGFVPTTTPVGVVLLTVSDGSGSVTQTISVPEASELQIYVAEAWSLTQRVNNPVDLYAYAYSSAIGGVNYQWTVTPPVGNAFNLDSLGSVSFIPTQEGLYSIDLTVSDGCGSSLTRQLSVTVTLPPTTVTAASAYIQYRTHENAENNRYVAFIEYKDNGVPVSQFDLANGKLVDPSNNVLPVTPTYLQANYVVATWNAATSSFGTATAGGYSGYFFELGTADLPQGDYIFKTTLAEGQLLQTTRNVASRVEAPVVLSSSMNTTLNANNSLTLSWAAPTGTFDSYRVVVRKVAETGMPEIFYAMVPNGTTSITLSPTLLTQISLATGVTQTTPLGWEVQTRSYDANNFEIARGRSAIISLEPTTGFISFQ